MQSTIDKMSIKEKYYWELYEVYFDVYEKHIERDLKIMTAKGVLVEMESDLTAFHLKNKETEKSKAQNERLKILNSAVDVFANLSSANVHYKMSMNKIFEQNKTLQQDKEDMREEINSLRSQLEMATKELFDKP